MEFTYEGVVRHSFGFANPNHAAALFSILIPICWGLRKIYAGKVALFCIFVPEILLYLALLSTISRTGIAAVILGGALFFYLMHKHWGARLDRKSLLITALILAAAFATLLSFGILKRHYSWISSPDDSMLNRLILWQGGLQMFSENPSGVGTGLSGTIFTDFYQPSGAKLVFRTMVNSFLTFMAEQGILLSFLSAIPLFFAFAVSFISLRSDMPDRRKILFISLMASGSCAVVSGMSSTCFDLSTITGNFSEGPAESNSMLMISLDIAAFAVFCLLAYLPARHLRPLQIKLALMISLAASAFMVFCLMMTGMCLNSSRTESCTVTFKDDTRIVSLCPRTNRIGKMLVLTDEKVAGRKAVMDFIRNRYGGYSSDFPVSQMKNPESLFENYDIIFLCGDNATLAGSTKKARFLLYNPTLFTEAAVGKTEKIYLNPFDEFGCNRKWEKAFLGTKDKMQYLY